jgi:HEAT repeat protein
MHRSGWPLAAAVLAASAAPLLAQPPSASLSTSPATITEVGGKTLSQWMADLKHKDPSVRTQAIMSVVAFGEAAGAAVPLILDRCHDHDASPRVKAVVALKVMFVRPSDVPKVVKTLAELLARDQQAIVRYEAAAALVRYADDAKVAVPALLQGMGERGNWEIRHVCIVALRRAARDPRTGPDPHATYALLAALDDPVEKVRMEATLSLGAMGRPADPTLLARVLRALQQQLGSRDKVLALWSHVSLLALDDKVTDQSLRAIVAMLKNPERDLRVQVLGALAAIGPKARTGIPDVLDALDDKEAEVAAAACTALGRMGDPGPRVLEGLVRASRRKEPAVVWAACQAMADLGSPSPEVLAALTQVSQRRELDDVILQNAVRVKQQLLKGNKK